MEPITLIVSALAAGAAAGGGSVATQAIQDAYNGLKSLIGRKFGGKGDVQDALVKLEAKPESEPRKGVLAEELQTAGAGEDQEAIALARKLLALVESAGPRYTATLTGSGAIAQGKGALAVGEGGIALSGSVHGNIVTGDRNVFGAGPTQTAASATMPIPDESASVQTQLVSHRHKLESLRQERVTALGREAASLDLLIGDENKEIRRLEQRLDDLHRG